MGWFGFLQDEAGECDPCLEKGNHRSRTGEWILAQVVPHLLVLLFLTRSLKTDNAQMLYLRTGVEQLPGGHKASEWHRSEVGSWGETWEWASWAGLSRPVSWAHGLPEMQLFPQDK